VIDDASANCPAGDPSNCAPGRRPLPKYTAGVVVGMSQFKGNFAKAVELNSMCPSGTQEVAAEWAARYLHDGY
jgi:hypothetical protein